MDKQIADINGKLQALRFTLKKTNATVEKENEEVFGRQKTSITKMLMAISDLKQAIEENKFIAGESEQDVTAWGEDIERTISEADVVVGQLNQHIQRLKAENRLEESVREREQKQQLEGENYERQQAFELHERNQQLEFERKLFDQKLEYQKMLKESQPNPTTKITSAKLPKLVITRFNGSFNDWLRFWGQYSAEIDEAQIPDVMKFSYLKELVEPKIRTCIDGLPFTEDGYKRAKSILQQRYGNNSEIINSYVEEIVNLPTIASTRPEKIHPFYEKLVYCVQSLETLGKLNEVNGHVRLTLNKLPGIRGDLVRTEPKWKEWTFNELVAALFAWTERNPVETKSSQPEFPPKYRNGSSKAFQTQQADLKNRECVYCSANNHKSLACDTVTTGEERRKLLMEKKLCYNCTGARHRASECKSKQTCQNCGRRHHTSICDKKQSSEKLLTAHHSNDPEVIYPVVIIDIEGVKCRALLDSGAGSSYASAKLLDLLHKKPTETTIKRIEMLLGSTTTRVETFKVKVSAIDGNFSMEVPLSKVNRPQLMELSNPRYENLLKRYSHLDGVKMIDDDEKDQLPVHVVLGASEYARIKTKCGQKVGSPGQPVAEKTVFGWTIMSPGTETDSSKMLLTQTSSLDYEELCRLDVLGLEDTAENDQNTVHAEFKEQLTRDAAGWYETGLPWKGNHPELPSNKKGSLQRLQSLLRKLNRTSNTEKYNEIIQEQLREGVVENAPNQPKGREFYVPHKPVIRENAESTKLRVVYDASAKESEGVPSLNDCLHTGPSLQNKLWSVLVRGRFHPVAITGDLQKAFLQVRIREDDRDALRFYWKSGEKAELQTLRFTRALFGLAPSPFLLGAVIDHHLGSWESRKPQVVAEIRKSIYVDDLISGSTTVSQAKELRDGAIEIFDDATFKLHKWNSNVEELEPKGDVPEQDETTFAKQQLGARVNESKILGLSWDKQNDTLKVVYRYPKVSSEPTKRSVLADLAKIYDPLGLVSPTMLTGKLIYRDICDHKIAWDAPIPRQLGERWQRWKSSLPSDVVVPRSTVRYQEPIQSITLHGFGDASANGVSAAIYAVVSQESGTTQRLVAAKARLAKRNTTIPRLELISAHMATNLISNVKNALTVGFPVTEIHSWLDSSVALHWIQGRGEYKQFVSNRVHKIQAHQEIIWHHVPTTENPADLGSRGGSVTNAKLWWNGPDWLGNSDEWPPQISIKSSPESQAEAKLIKEVVGTTSGQTDLFDELLSKHQLWRVLRVGGRINRFLKNCKCDQANRTSGPLRTEEIEYQKRWWTKRVQSEARSHPRFQEESLELNLQENDDGVLECRGRILGIYPVYLPDTHPYTEKLVEESHLQTLHGGVGITMAKVRERYWVPRLRRIVKKVRGNCWGCKRFRTKAFQSPPPGNLPNTRTQGTTPYQVIGVDFAGPIRYRAKSKAEKRAYLALYGCSLTRGVYLDLLPSLETEDFIASLRRFIARRGRPELIYSDNGGTFKAAAKWLKEAQDNEKFNDFLAQQSIRWQFNLSRAPWWGGQFERLIGLFKNAFYKTIGNATLRWAELEEVVLDVEVSLNNRPLSYLEDDIQLPLLTPNSMLNLNPNDLPNLEAHQIPDKELRKRSRYLTRCKEMIWNRWTKEYVRGLREQHRRAGGKQTPHPKIGDVVIIRGDSKNRNHWKLGIVVKLIQGRDGIIRGAKLKTSHGVLERATQHLSPLELTCDRSPPALNPTAPEFAPRPRRDAAAAATVRIQDIGNDQDY